MLMSTLSSLKYRASQGGSRSAIAYLICRARVPRIRAFSYLVI